MLEGFFPEAPTSDARVRLWLPGDPPLRCPHKDGAAGAGDPSPE